MFYLENWALSLGEWSKMWCGSAYDTNKKRKGFLSFSGWIRSANHWYSHIIFACNMMCDSVYIYGSYLANWDGNSMAMMPNDQHGSQPLRRRWWVISHRLSSNKQCLASDFSQNCPAISKGNPLVFWYSEDFFTYMIYQKGIFFLDIWYRLIYI